MRPLALLALLACIITAADSPWPLSVERPGGTITVYQPQPEKLAGSTLTARSAVSWLPTGADEAQRIFAAVWMQAELDIDRDAGVAKARSVKITKVLLPNGETKDQDKDAGARAAVEQAIVALGLQTDLDRLAATIEEVDGGTAGLGEQVPRIMVRTKPAILVTVAGKPQWKAGEGGIERLASSPSFILRADGKLWLRVQGDWLTAAELAGPWAYPEGAAPDAVKAAATAAGLDIGTARINGTAPPEVIVVDSAAELVVFDGDPEFEALTPDGALEVADNTEDDVVREKATGRCFVLCSGRWFAAPALADGQTWALVPGDELPASFAAIPATGERAHLRAHVAGTDEATEAAALAQVPQTAQVPRTATITVAFEGEPRWVQIEGREAAWAENSADAVFRIPGPRYYCCRDAVWYEAAATTGPWTVATSKPEALDNLPASCPWSNCNGATVYQSNTEYVYVGCTPAYYGWYVYGGCPVYGPGYWYGGYWGGGYWGYPVTYGARVRYNPYNGNWAVGIGAAGPGWAVGGIAVGGWWGSAGVGIGSGGGVVVRPPGGAAGARPTPYDRVPGAKRPQLAAEGDRLRGSSAGNGNAAGVGAAVAAGAVVGAAARRDQGNYAVDRDGNVLRAGADGKLEQRGDRNWNQRPATPAQRPAERPATPAQRPAERPAQRPATPAQRPAAKPAPITRQQPQQVQQMRSRGETRVQQRASPPPRPASRPAGGGGARGGGGGGRRR